MSSYDPPEQPDLARLPPPQPPPPPQADAAGYLPGSNWNYSRTILVLVMGIMVGPLLAVIAVAIAAGPDAAQDLSPTALLAVQSVASILAVYVMSRWRGTGSWRADFGFSISARHVWGIGAGMALQMGAFVVTWPLIYLFAPDDGPQQEIARVATGLSGWELAAFAVMVAVVTPVFEEIVFRGMLLGRLVKTMGRHRAVAISGAAFASIHLLDPNAVLVIPGLFLIGVVLGYMALRSGGIGLPIFAHMGTNGLAVLLLVFVEELEEIAETVDAVVAPLL